LVGTIGEIHPDAAAAYDIYDRVYVGELDFEKKLENAKFDRTFVPLPKFSAVVRDLAVLVQEEVPVGVLQDVIQKSGGKLLESVELFDVYQGQQVREGYKSGAFSLTFRKEERTLTDDEVTLYMIRS